MKDFILDLTYKDATVVNSNGDILAISSSNLPHTSVTHHTINLNKSNYIPNNNNNDKFNVYSFIDYL